VSPKLRGLLQSESRLSSGCAMTKRIAIVVAAIVCLGAAWLDPLIVGVALVSSRSDGWIFPSKYHFLQTLRIRKKLPCRCVRCLHSLPRNSISPPSDTNTDKHPICADTKIRRSAFPDYRGQNNILFDLFPFAEVGGVVLRTSSHA
jgi:hypothetical protein